MVRVPDNLKIYHITHAENLPGILCAGALWSDAERIARGVNSEIVGMSKIKKRRLEDLEVDCHPGTTVGEYVPFYFCPRSVMLAVIYYANHPDLAYRGGQQPIVHLEADLQEVVAWADAEQRRWAFSLSNAGARYVEFRARVDQLGEINWPAVNATDFRATEVKEGKQAEFLVHGSYPWTLVRRIGVHNAAVGERVRAALERSGHQPPVWVERSWYFPD
ncbi:MAG: DUF4433 domain-containing protein [Candidatus Lambdaproteobacteria bacterium]|nr:DUF4433 domain-containing protein [Candidatus Lambdaproteobacteria bacterium]